MMIPTWLPATICIVIAIILLVVLYYRPYKSSNTMWQWINKHVIGVFCTIFLSALFIPTIISWTAPRIWIVTNEDVMTEKYILFYYKGWKLGLSNRYVKNDTDNQLIAEKVFYGKPKSGSYPQNEYFVVEPSEIIQISGEPRHNKPGLTIVDRHYGASHKYGRYQWFIYKNQY